jgi:hypothetical protein
MQPSLARGIWSARLGGGTRTVPSEEQTTTGKEEAATNWLRRWQRYRLTYVNRLKSEYQSALRKTKFEDAKNFCTNELDEDPFGSGSFREEVTVHKRKGETWVSVFVNFWLIKCSELLSVFLLEQEMNYTAEPLIIYKNNNEEHFLTVADNLHYRNFPESDLGSFMIKDNRERRYLHIPLTEPMSFRSTKDGIIYQEGKLAISLTPETIISK